MSVFLLSDLLLLANYYTWEEKFVTNLVFWSLLSSTEETETWNKDDGQFKDWPRNTAC